MFFQEIQSEEMDDCGFALLDSASDIGSLIEEKSEIADEPADISASFVHFCL